MPFMSSAGLRDFEATFSSAAVTVHIVKTAEPATPADVNTNTVGWVNLTAGAIATSGSDQEVVVPAVTDGSGTVTDDGATAAYYAVTSQTGAGSVTTLHAAGALSANQVVYTANGFNVGAITLTNKAATAA